jgi:hypothetical protein
MSILTVIAAISTATAPVPMPTALVSSAFGQSGAAVQSTFLAADPPPHAPAHGRRAKDRRIYDDRGRYLEPRRISRDDRIWRGRDGRYYCERDNGTTGLLIGAGVGALAGRAIDTRGDRTVGTLLGGALGAVIGREIDRGELRCR